MVKGNRSVRLVRDQLVTRSLLAVVGEAPGADEELHLQPFVGVSGALLNRWLHLAGLSRSDVSVMNVVNRRPPRNEINKIPKDELEFWREDLQRRLLKLPNVRVIVPVGNTALEAVLGTPRVRLSQNKKLTITKANGFYFDNVTLLDGRKVLVLPVFHPAATFRDGTLTKVCEELWRRIGKEMRHGLGADVNTLSPLLEDTFVHETSPHPDDALEYAREVIAAGKPISVDIETPKEPPRDKILICGFSNDGVNSMVMPYDDHRGLGPGGDWTRGYREAIRMICESDLEKIGANLLFDAYELMWLKKIWLKNVKYDVRTMHLTWDPRRPHDLSSMTATTFRTRYWKSADDEAREADDYHALCKYNGNDVCSTWHVAFDLKRRLEQENLLKVYHRIYGKRFYPLLRISLHGTPVNHVERDKRYNELDEACSKIRDELEAIAGVSLSGDKSLSSKKIGQFIHGPKIPPPRPLKLTPKKGLVAKTQPSPYPSGLELKPIIDKDTHKPTTDEVALRRHRLRVIGKNKRAERALDLILDHRRKEALANFYQEKCVDKDNRLRCSFGFAETARLTSSATAYGTGRNNQNSDRESRAIFLPDDGCIFIQVDLSQAEDRIAKAYSKDQHLIHLARLKSYEYDAHSDLGTKIFNVPVEQINKKQRYLAKRVRHAAQRGVGGQRFADELLKDDIVQPKSWCEEILEAYYAAEPGIKNGYFPYVREQVISKEMLVTPWGFRATFYGERKDEALMREALSFLLQAGCVLTLDLQGLIPLDYLIEHEMLQTTRINNEVHDSVIASSPLSEAFEVAEFLVQNLERPVNYDGVELSIPADVKIGATLADDDSYEWKKFPTRDEFMREAERLFELAERKRKEAEQWPILQRQRQRQQRQLMKASQG